MSKLFEQLLERRGIGEDFLRPRYEDCADPGLLPGMRAATERVKQAKERREKVLIYGDYDVDGVTASTVMRESLRLAGVTEVTVMLPNRFTDGYGMSKKVVQAAIEQGAQLVVTVDCGSRNNEIVAELAAHNIDTIVTDHHECEETLPEAVAVVNPKRKDVKVPPELRSLAGVGVAFKLAQALVKEGLIPEGQEKWLLDLVVIGTICDSMELTLENRRLCYYGMKVLTKTRRPGLKELIRLAGVRKLDGDAISYLIGPRLNAAGRMDTAEKALALLMAERKTEAARLAAELEELNTQRKAEQGSAVEAVRKRGVGEEPVIVVEGKWHEGVLGIIAGRLVEEYRRPAFVLSEVNGVMKGSGRSFGDFNLAEALKACQDCIIGGGGHAEACGLKVAPERLTEFRKRVNEYYRGLKLQNQERFLAVGEDLVVTDFQELTLEFLEELKLLEPYSIGNAEPVVLLSEVRIAEAAKLGDQKQHLRLQVWDQQERSLKLIRFFAPEEYLRLEGGETVNLWVTLKENEFKGIRSVEGEIKKLAVV